MRRILLLLGTMLAAAVLVAVGILWVRSYIAPDSFIVGRPGSTCSYRLVAYRGSLLAAVLDDYGPFRIRAWFSHRDDGAGGFLRAELDAQARGAWWVKLGFGYRVENMGLVVVDGVDYTVWMVPCWFVAGLDGALLALGGWLMYRSRRRRRRDLQGCCLSCGYDLRASRVRCPECGAPIPAVAPPA